MGEEPIPRKAGVGGIGWGVERTSLGNEKKTVSFLKRRRRISALQGVKGGGALCGDKTKKRKKKKLPKGEKDFLR